MVGPLIIQFGTDAQKKRFLPKILARRRGLVPGLLGAERRQRSRRRSSSRAEDDGKGNFVVNGQKTWTTYAQYADWIFVLARTDRERQEAGGHQLPPRRHEDAGRRAKPFLTTGGTPAFCETFFENVEVPKENLVGPLNGGWTMAKALLGHERTLIAAVGGSTRALRTRQAHRAATRRSTAGRCSTTRASAPRSRGSRSSIESLQMANYRALAGAQLGKAPGPGVVDPQDPRLGDLQQEAAS